MIGKYILLNQKLIENKNFVSQIKSEQVVYEVLRIIDSIPLFYREHYQRLIDSCSKIDKQINIGEDALFDQIIELIEKNGRPEGNLMIKVFFNSHYYDITAFYIAHSYPTDDDYSNGVKVGFINAERVNPEAKVEQNSIRQRANNLIATEGYYEVLLINSKNQITEGSRSNLFLIVNNKLITAPLNNVLKGITLCKVLDIAKQLKIEVEFKCIDKNDLNTVDAMFITGTSPKILSIKNAGNFEFNEKHPIILQISQEYNRLIKSYIRQKKGLK